jgi:hypothetical protein
MMRKKFVNGRLLVWEGDRTGGWVDAGPARRRDPYQLVIRRANLRNGGGSYAATFETGKPIDLALDMRGIPKTEQVAFIREALGSLAGSVFVALEERKDDENDT